MRHVIFDGHPVISVDGFPQIRGHSTSALIGGIGRTSQIRFSDGTRLSNVIACPILSQFIEDNVDATYYLEGDEKRSTLVAVRLRDGSVVDVDENAYMQSANALQSAGWMYAICGVITLIVLVGFLVLIYAFYVFSKASEAKRAVGMSRLVTRTLTADRTDVSVTSMGGLQAA